ncbi:PEP-CTERM sorting domain-containing protein [Thauera humireducens]|uniref:PEP-CTERM sorting domain-containing protein n=1 Tax=Thauera humireducens TaxID=1134435 RepID=UPI00311F608E
MNFSVPSDLQIYGNGGSAQFSVSNPGINVLDATDPLLTGVSLPAGPGGFSIGRIAGIDFVAGVTEVLDWSDGVGMLGYKDFGLGTVFGLNMHVITSDTAYQVINQPWATQLIVNAANFGANNAVPEPTTIALIGLGLAGLGFSRRKTTRLTIASTRTNKKRG